MSLKILVTGGAGFIGSNFCNINKNKFDITALDNLFLGYPDNLDPDIKFIQGDSCKEKDLEKCGKNFDIILHLAGTSSAPMFEGEKFITAYQNSINSFLQVLDFAKKCGTKKILYASTSSLYGNQELPLSENKKRFSTNHYSVSKIFYENCAKCFQKINPEIDTIGFRFMSVYGPNEEAKGKFANLISQFIWDMARDLPPVIYGDGNQSRDFTNVEDIVQAITLAIETGLKLNNQIFNIGTGQSSSLNEMISLIKKYLHTDISPKYIKNPVKENYILAQHADISKIQEILGYSPKIDLETGIQKQIKLLRKNKIRETSSDYFREK